MPPPKILPTVTVPLGVRPESAEGELAIVPPDTLWAPGAPAGLVPVSEEAGSAAAEPFATSFIADLGDGYSTSSSVDGQMFALDPERTALGPLWNPGLADPGMSATYPQARPSLVFPSWVSSEVYYEAELLWRYFDAHLDAAVSLCAQIFPADQVGVIFRSRAKPATSIAVRLQREIEDGSENLSDAALGLTDGIGVSVKLHTAGEHGVSAFVEALCQAVREQKISILKISDNHGSGHPGYLTEEAWNRIRDVCREYQEGRKPVRDKREFEERHNGFTTLQVTVLFPGNIIGDIQVRGSMVDWLARAEGVSYSLRQFYDVGVDTSTEVFRQFKQEFDAMYFRSAGSSEPDLEKQYAYDAYINRWYHYARLTESGIAAEVPTLPAIFASPLFDPRVMHAYKLCHPSLPYGVEAAAYAAAQMGDETGCSAVAKNLAQEFRDKQAYATAAIARLLPVELVGEITYQRAKKARSIDDKLKARYGGVIPEEIAVARDVVKDGNGVSLMLHTGSYHGSEKLVEHLLRAIASKELELLNISNQHGEDSEGYLDEEQVARLMEAAHEHQSVGCTRDTRLKEIKKSGFSCLQLNVRLPDGTCVEIQVKGSMVVWIWKAEGTVRKLREGKSVDVEETEVLAQFQSAVQGLTREEFENIYCRYVHDYYAYARKMEQGVQPAPMPPVLPAGFDHPLFDLLALHEYTLLHSKSRRR